MSKYKVGQRFKIIPLDNPENWWSEEIIGVYKNGKIKTIVIGCGGKESELIGQVDIYNYDWFGPQSGYSVIKLNHITTKLGKILYK